MPKYDGRRLQQAIRQERRRRRIFFYLVCGGILGNLVAQYDQPPPPKPDVTRFSELRNDAVESRIALCTVNALSPVEFKSVQRAVLDPKAGTDAAADAVTEAELACRRTVLPDYSAPGWHGRVLVRIVDLMKTGRQT